MDYTDRIPDEEYQDKMTAYLTALAFERVRVAELTQKTKEVMEKALQESGYNELKEELEAAKKNVETFYDGVCEEALKATVLPAAVKIKTFKVVELGDMFKIKEWCMKWMAVALKVDTKKFEDAVKDGGIPEELGKVREEKRAQVASDLSAYL